MSYILCFKQIFDKKLKKYLINKSLKFLTLIKEEIKYFRYFKQYNSKCKQFKLQNECINEIYSLIRYKKSLKLKRS